MGSIWGAFGITFSTLFSTSFSDPHLTKIINPLGFDPGRRQSPSPKPLTLLLLSKKQGRMQRPSQTQRVLALPVIRQGRSGRVALAPFPQTPNPFSSLQEARKNATSIADSKSLGASRHPPASGWNPTLCHPSSEPPPLFSIQWPCNVQRGLRES